MLATHTPVVYHNPTFRNNPGLEIVTISFQFDVENKRSVCYNQPVNPRRFACDTRNFETE